LKARCDEPCLLSYGGELPEEDVFWGFAVLRRRGSGTTAANVRITSARERHAIRRALAHGKPVSIDVELTAWDRQGNATARELTLRFAAASVHPARVLSRALRPRSTPVEGQWNGLRATPDPLALGALALAIDPVEPPAAAHADEVVAP